MRGLGDSLHVRSSFWYLIMASTKLICYVYARHSFERILKEILIIVILIFHLSFQVRNVLNLLLFTINLQVCYS